MTTSFIGRHGLASVRGNVSLPLDLYQSDYFPGRYEDWFQYLFISAVASALCFVAVAAFYLASSVFNRD